MGFPRLPEHDLGMGLYIRELLCTTYNEMLFIPSSEISFMLFKAVPNFFYL